MVHRINHLQPHFPLPVSKQTNAKQSTHFSDILKNSQTVKVSKHASERLNERNIKINPHQWQKISEKMVEAKQKGVTDSLIVMNEATLLVSTENNTVVTAMNKEEASERIFTNINGTILIND